MKRRSFFARLVALLAAPSLAKVAAKVSTKPQGLMSGVALDAMRTETFAWKHVYKTGTVTHEELLKLMSPDPEAVDRILGGNPEMGRLYDRTDRP